MEACGHERGHRRIRNPIGLRASLLCWYRNDLQVGRADTHRWHLRVGGSDIRLDIMGEGSRSIISVICLAIGERQRPDCQTKRRLELDCGVPAMGVGWSAQAQDRRFVRGMRCSLWWLLVGGWRFDTDLGGEQYRGKLQRCTD